MISMRSLQVEKQEKDSHCAGSSQYAVFLDHILRLLSTIPHSPLPLFYVPGRHGPQPYLQSYLRLKVFPLIL